LLKYPYRLLINSCFQKTVLQNSVQLKYLENKNKINYIYVNT